MSLNQMLKFCSVLVLFSIERRLTMALLIALTGVTGGLPLTVHAQDFAVNSTVDRLDVNAGDGRCDTGQQLADGTPECTLRAAVQEASAQLTVPHVITIPAGTYALSLTSDCKYILAGSTYVHHDTMSELCLRGQITLKGAGAAQTVINGGALGSVVFISADGIASISGVTISNGYATFHSRGGGGGIDNQGTLTLSDSIVSNNQTLNEGGGGIDNAGTLNVTGSTITANTAGGGGGGISVEQDAVLNLDHSSVTYNSASNNGNSGGIECYICHLTISNSTLAYNTGKAGAALSTTHGSNGADYPLLITNSTFAHNTAPSGGAAILFGNFIHATLRNVTVAYNSGGGINSNQYDTSRRIYLYNTLIANNTMPDVANPSTENCQGYFYSNGYNLIGPQSNSVSQLSQGGQPQKQCHLDGPETNLLGVDARLGELAYNGGPTQTVSLEDSSPAIDAGSPVTLGSGNTASCPLSDQRGVLRPLGPACDIGAVERSKDFRLTGVLPKAVGNSGLSQLILSGDGFAPGASIKLSRSGQSDLIANDVTVESAGSSASTFFDFSRALTGLWDVTLTNSNGGTVSLPGALTVESPHAAQVWAVLSGPRQVRPGVPATYTLLYGNGGDLEADAVPIQVALPAGFDILFPPIATPPQQSGQVSTDWTKSGFDAQARQDGKLRNYLFLAPVVPGGVQLSFTFKLIPRGVDDGDHFQMNVEVGDPYYTGGVIDPGIISQVVGGAQSYAQSTLGGTISPDVATKLGNYAANQLDLEVKAGRAALASSLSGQPLLYALPQNTQDIAEYGIAQSGGTVAAFQNISVKPMDANPGSGTVPVCNGGVTMPEGSSCLTAWVPPPTPKKSVKCAHLAGTSLTNGDNECSPKPRAGCPDDPNCSGPSAVLSVDPNGKYGVWGKGDEGYLISGNPMDYLITFENQPTATAPAATVTITDQLDTSTLDTGTFQFGPLGWGGYKLTPPPGVTSFHSALDLRPGQNVLVDVNASLDTASGQLKWTFTSLDPITETPVTAADAGFLPPDTAAPNGEGYVSYSLYPKKPSDGNKVCNEASIVFDTNSAINTPKWCNIYDDSAPVSKVDALPANETSHSFTVNWSGTDAGSGIATYSIYVSDNGGAFKLWQNTVTTTSATYTGEDGHTYGFYSVATDKLGHAEQKKTADTITAAGAAALSATLAPGNLAFGNVRAGETSAAQTLTLTNTGTADLSITSISIAGTNGSEFHIAANTCGKTLAPSHSCEIDVTFGPTMVGDALAMLSVVDNAGTQTSTLDGAGTAPAAPQAALSPASVSFGSTNVGSTSAAQSFALKNGGNAVLPINSISISGTNAAEFVISNNTCGYSLAAASSCSIGVLFKPSSTGDATATLSVVDSVGTQTANLSGVGTAVISADFNITASPAQQSVQRGSTASYTIQLVSADSRNPFLNPVTLTASGLPSGASVAFSPASLVPGADKATTSTMTVTMPALTAELENSPKRPTGALSAVASLACVILMWPLRRRRPGLSSLILLLAGLACAAGLTACGSNGSGVTPPASTSTITVTGTSGSTTHATTVTLKVN